MSHRRSGLCALLLAPLPALAQFAPTAATPSPQIYGRIDLSVNAVDLGTGGSRETVSSDTSLLGFRAVEDLGGGMLAYIKMEHGLSPDTGTATSPTTFWNREAFVGLRSARYGAIELGSFFSPFVWLTGRTDPFARGMMGAQLALLQGTGVRGYAPVYLNSVQLASPAWGPVRLRALARLDEGTASENYAASVDYSKDRLHAGLAVESVRASASSVASTAGGTVRVRTVGLGLSYRFDAVHLFSYVQRQTAPGATSAQGWVLGGRIPVGKGEVRASVVRNARSTGDATQFALGYWHTLSRRTGVYATVAAIDNEGSANFALWPARQDAGGTAPAPGAGVKGLQIGLRHSF